MNLSLFYRVIANAYDLIDVIYFRIYERSPRKAVLDAISGDEKILDLCAGTATNAIAIAEEKPNTQIIGIDLSSNMLNVAKCKVKKAKVKNVTLYQMDATQLKFKPQCFDKILLSLVLHELDEELARKIIAEAKRILKDNGEIIVTEWEVSRNWKNRLLFAPIHYLEPKSYRKFIKKDLYFYFAKHGLEIGSYKHCDYTRVITLKKIKEKV